MLTLSVDTAAAAADDDDDDDVHVCRRLDQGRRRASRLATEAARGAARRRNSRQSVDCARHLPITNDVRWADRGASSVSFVVLVSY